MTEGRGTAPGPGGGPDELAGGGMDGPDAGGLRGEVVWRALLAGAALVVVALFLWTLRELLNPFVLFWVLVAVLLPFRSRAGHSLWIAVAAILTLLWVLDTTGFLLAPFILAFVLAYIVDPVVDRLDDWTGERVGRSLVILILALPVLALVVVGVVFGLPALGQQVGDLIDRTPALLRRIADWVESAREELLTADLPLVDEEALVERLRSVDAETMVAFLQERQAEIGRRIWSGVLGLGRGLGSVLTVLGYVVLTPVLTFYLLRDYDGLITRSGELVPASRRPGVLGFFREYDALLSGYLRGQITVALLVGFITGVGLAVLQFPYAILVGAVVTVFSVVPYLGLLLSLIPAVLIALTSGSVLLSLGKVAVVFAAAQGLEGAVISPRIVGGSVGLHPVWVVLALAVGGFYFGFVGLLIAVPVAVGVKLLVLRGLERYRSSAFYRSGAPGRV